MLRGSKTVPIYEYRCSDCGHKLEALQKISDPKLTTCPECGKESLTKLVSASAFVLKGSGWYVTDFRDNNKAGGSDKSKPADKTSESAKSDSGESKSDTKADNKGESKKPESADSKKTETKPAKKAAGE